LAAANSGGPTLRHGGINFSWKSLSCLILLPLFPAVLCAQTPPAETPSANQKSYSDPAAALHRGDLAAARQSFEAAVRQNPRDPEARNGLGMVMLAQNDPRAAIPQFQAALRLKPSFDIAYINLSTALLRTGDLEGASREANSAVRVAPHQPDAF